MYTATALVLMIAHPNTGTTGSGGAGAEGSGWPTGGPRPPASQCEQTEPRELNITHYWPLSYQLYVCYWLGIVS